jgi:glycosyltransferase involved in cell wall biosynthesis
MSESHSVSVIVPTRVLHQRGALLRRALASILDQQGVRAVPIVVVNGPDRDLELTRQLRADPRLRVATLDVANLPAALQTGREMVDTRWFAELDDDDILLPGALALRLQALLECPDLDAVITNGFRRSGAGDTPSIPEVRAVDRDPLRALVFGRISWLLPGSWLCRTDAVGPEFFEHMPSYRECTYLALRLAATRRIAILRHPTVVWHADTPDSESKSPAYAFAGAVALRRMLELDLPPDVRVALRSRLAGACHTAANLHLREGQLREAWRWHFRSLVQPGGWRRALYTPRFVYALLRS